MCIMAAASSRICPNIAITVCFIFSYTIFLNIPSSGFVVGEENSGDEQRNKMVLGSKPPGCETKCLSCRPCMATLVIPPQKWNKFEKLGDEDDSYYLLAWKCKCGDKLFQP